MEWIKTIQCHYQHYQFQWDTVYELQLFHSTNLVQVKPKLLKNATTQSNYNPGLLLGHGGKLGRHKLKLVQYQPITYPSRTAHNQL